MKYAKPFFIIVTLHLLTAQGMEPEDSYVMALPKDSSVLALHVLAAQGMEPEDSYVQEDIRKFRVSLCAQNRKLMSHMLSYYQHIQQYVRAPETAILVYPIVEDSTITEALIAAGAPIDVCHSYDGMTPLCSAACEGNLGIMQTLLSHGADINKTTSQNNHTALSSALCANQPAVASFLLGCPGIERCINVKTATGDTPLHYAAAQGHTDIVARLIGMGAEISPIAEDGFTPLRCTMWPSDVYHIAYQSAEYLLQHGAAKELEPNWLDQHGVKKEFPDIIELAFKRRDHVLFALLLKLGAQPYTRKGKSLLAFAREIARDEIVRKTVREKEIKIQNLCQEWHRQHNISTDS